MPFRATIDRVAIFRAASCRAPTMLLLGGLLTCLGSTLMAPAAWAHNIVETQAMLLLRDDGAFQLDLICDLDALALGADPSTDSAELATYLATLPAEDRAHHLDRLKRYFERRVRVLADGESLPFRVSFPQQLEATAPSTEAPSTEAPSPEAPSPDPGGRSQTARRDIGSGPPSFLGTLARLEGRLPSRASGVAVRLSRSFPPLVLKVLWEESASPTQVEKGLPSPSVSLSSPARPLGGELFDAPAALVAYGIWAVTGTGLVHVLFLLALTTLSPSPWRDGGIFVVMATVVAGVGVNGGLWLAPSPTAVMVATSLLVLAGLHLLGARRASISFGRPWPALRQTNITRSSGVLSSGGGQGAKVGSPAWLGVGVAGCGMMHGQLAALRFLALQTDSLWGVRAEAGARAGIQPATINESLGSAIELAAGPGASGAMTSSTSILTSAGSRFALGVGLALLAQLALSAALARALTSPRPSGHPPHRSRLPSLAFFLLFAVAGLGALFAAFMITPQRASEGASDTPARSAEVLKTPLFTLFLQPLPIPEEEDP